MLIIHNDKSPKIDSNAYIAPNAVICGDVTIGKNCKVMFGAQIIAEDGAIVLDENTVVLENAVLRSTEKYTKYLKVEKTGRKTTFLDDEYFSFTQN